MFLSHHVRSSAGDLSLETPVLFACIGNWSPELFSPGTSRLLAGRVRREAPVSVPQEQILSSVGVGGGVVSCLGTGNKLVKDQACLLPFPARCLCIGRSSVTMVTAR